MQGFKAQVLLRAFSGVLLLGSKGLPIGSKVVPVGVTL